jgi:predicted TIM-barrel fold metal-dependent hydrolase
MDANPQQTAYGRIYPPRADWLARASVEPIIEPELPIVDSHHHIWRDPELYMLDEVLADTGTGHNVVATVFIECQFQYCTNGPAELRSVREVGAVADLAEQFEAHYPGKTRVAEGVVGYADLTLGDRVEPVLASLVVAGRGRFRGVRNSAGWHQDPVIGNNHHGAGPGHYLRADFRAGLNRVSAMGLSFDALVYHHQHADLLDLARACPDANIIMNHTGMPLGYGPFAGRKREVYAQWRAKLPDIAACANVSMKLGGMMMRLASYDYNQLPAPPSSEQLAALWRPYIEPCIELFGPKRCTFESNFPVDKMGIGYSALWNAFKRIAAKASADEKAALFSDTARRIYRLG